MKCSECMGWLYDHFATPDNHQEPEWREHVANCPKCTIEYHYFLKIAAALKTNTQLKAPDAIKVEILRQVELMQTSGKQAKVVSISFLWKKIAVTAAVLLLLLTIPSLFRGGAGEAKASYLVMTAIDSSQDIRNYVMHFSVRTGVNESFEQIDPNQPMVQHTIVRSFKSPDAWRISKPGREVVFDGKDQYLYMPVANLVYKGDEQAGFVSWMRLLLDPVSILWKEKDNAESKDAKIEIYKRNGDTCLTITTKAAGDFINDYLRNDNIGTADSRREYVFDGKTHRLKGLKIYLIASTKETLIFSTDAILYNTTLNPGQLSFSTPIGAEIKTMRDLSPTQPGSLSGSTNKEAARTALEDLSKGDFDTHKTLWSEYGRFWLALLSKDYKGVVVVRIGEPFRSVSVSGDIVPYEIRFPDGFIKRFRLVLDYKNTAKTWVVKGVL